jgi:DNA-binding MarR family transcriptional regulator
MDGLALAATDGQFAENDPAARLERACTAAASGRRAARALAEWTKRFGLTEAEFQLLWRLRSASADGPNQATLAGTLAFSPAQISAIVERVRQRGLIFEQSASGDRRRHHWQLSIAGRQLLNQMLDAATSFCDQAAESEIASAGASRRGEAAA